MKGPKPIYRPTEPGPRPKAPESEARRPKSPGVYRPAPKRAEPR